MRWICDERYKILSKYTTKKCREIKTWKRKLEKKKMKILIKNIRKLTGLKFDRNLYEKLNWLNMQKKLVKKNRICSE